MLGIDCKCTRGNTSDDFVLYLDCGGGCTAMCIYQNSPTIHFKRVALIVLRYNFG